MNTLLAAAAIWVGAIMQPTEVSCRLVDGSRPAQLLTFERVDSGRATSDVIKVPSRVWLRLHNNTTCAINFYGGHFHRNADGSVTMDPKDGEETGVSHDVYDARRDGSPRQWSGGDVHTLASLRGGFSVLFAVPVEHFRGGRSIAVPFAYSWEGDAIRRYNLRHYVYFVRDQLPKALRDKIER